MIPSRSSRAGRASTRQGSASSIASTTVPSGGVGAGTTAGSRLKPPSSTASGATRRSNRSAALSNTSSIHHSSIPSNNHLHFQKNTHSDLNNSSDKNNSSSDTSITDTTSTTTAHNNTNNNSGSNNNSQDAGSNIKVVVRCRGRNDREIKAKSHVVVQTAASTPTDVVIGFDDSTRMGHDSKIYKVDHVFGPEADQSMVYDEVVAPMIAEVLSGMNCTIFAYGQTGTGKT